MIAPLLPALAAIFSTQPASVGLAIPAYLIPYGVMTLVWGPMSDQLGRGGRRRAHGGHCRGELCRHLHRCAKRHRDRCQRRRAHRHGPARRPLRLPRTRPCPRLALRGHGGRHGGGIDSRALLEPVIGWPGLFLGVSGLGVLVLALLLRRRDLLSGRPSGEPRRLGIVARGYIGLLASFRSQRTYAYVLVNAVVHSGIFTWLGLSFQRHYGFGEIGIGLPCSDTGFRASYCAPRSVGLPVGTDGPASSRSVSSLQASALTSWPSDPLWLWLASPSPCSRSATTSRSPCWPGS